jgi:hypothetical protein
MVREASTPLRSFPALALLALCRTALERSPAIESKWRLSLRSRAAPVAGVGTVPVTAAYAVCIFPPKVEDDKHNNAQSRSLTTPSAIEIVLMRRATQATIAVPCPWADPLLAVCGAVRGTREAGRTDAAQTTRQLHSSRPRRPDALRAIPRGRPSVGVLGQAPRLAGASLPVDHSHSA